MIGFVKTVFRESVRRACRAVLEPRSTHHFTLIGPEVQVAGEGFAALIDPDGPGHADFRPTRPRTAIMSGARKLSRGTIAGKKCKKVSTTVRIRILVPVASWS